MRMIKIPTVRGAAKLGAGAVAASAGAGILLLAGQVLAARLHRYAQPDLALAARISTGPAGTTPLRLVLLGDSTALGVGVDRVTDTVGARLADLLAGGPAAGGRRVECSSVAVSGSHAADLAMQVSRALVGTTPDVAVILVGTADVVGLRRPARCAAALYEAVRRLRAAGPAVVVGTCPDLATVRAIASPLRQLGGWLSRRMGRAQAVATQAAGGIPVDLAARVGPVFRADPGTLSQDGYHPSADGYRVWAHALFPAVARAAGVAAS